MGGVDLDLAPHQVAPAHFALRQLEAPMRTAALRLQRGAVRRRERQYGAVVDRRLVLRDLALAAALQCFRRFVSRIETAAGFEFLRGGAMGLGALDLATEKVVC